MNSADWRDELLFVFGSLMDSAVLTIVSGCQPDRLAVSVASARGFKQCEVAEESCPVLVPSTGATCNGHLIAGLDAAAIDRIYFYEGDEYSLCPISVSVADQPKSAFYFRDTGIYTVRDTEWDFEHWQKTHKQAFLSATHDYMKLYGTMSATEADVHWQQLTAR